jgi:hypothetical protein
MCKPQQLKGGLKTSRLQEVFKISLHLLPVYTPLKHGEPKAGMMEISGRMAVTQQELSH